MSGVPACVINGNGKYMLLLVSLYPDEEMYVVRGGTQYEYHANIVRAAEKEFVDIGTVAECGGGFVAIDEYMKTIRIYGKSQKYGPVRYTDMVCAVIRERYTGWVISHSDI